MSQLLQNAAYGTVMILAVSVLRRTLKDRLVPEARLALWAVCLFRLLTPAAPESVLSLWGLSRLFKPQTPAVTALVPASQLYTLPQAVPAPQPAPGISWEVVLFAAWLAVSAALALRYVLIWLRTRRTVADTIPLSRNDPRYAPLPKCARLREGPMAGAPLTFGTIRPTVVLSPGLNGAELDCVLAHEGTHASRRDNLWHYAMALALAVHWWNPAVWAMSRLLRRDVELSCDRAALKKLGGDRRADYANTLVTLATQAEGPAFCQTFGQKAAEERILSIMKFKKTSLIGVIFSLTLVLTVTAAFASEPKQPDEHDNVKAGTDTSVTLVGISPANASQFIWIPDVAGTQDCRSDYAFVDPDNVDLSIMRERMAQRVADGELSQKAADSELARIENLLEEARQGYAKLFMYEDGWLYGMGVGQLVFGEDLGSGCFRSEDGTIYRQNEDGSWSKSDINQSIEVKLPSVDGASYTDPAPVPSAGPEPITAQSLVNTAPSTSCGMEGCIETRYHAHNDGRIILLSDPCPVEGCTITGNHLHGDVCYSCNGAGHSSGVCDGSCYTYTTLPDVISTSTHHSGSHHETGHH